MVLSNTHTHTNEHLTMQNDHQRC